MASAEQLKALVKSYIERDDAHFYAIAMQVAAHEAKLGHGKLAQELREMIDDAKLRANAPNIAALSRPVPIAQPRGELSNLLAVSYPKVRLADMILSLDISERIERLIKEQRQIALIRSHGLSPRRKVLLVGPPGTGKTMSAQVLAGELGIPLFIVRLDSLITKYMGETAAKLRTIFDAIGQVRGLYLFDEFDSIGSQRGLTNDVGEIRRVLNSFLQFIDQDRSESLIFAATNHPEILDYALFRRFDDIIEYQLPTTELAVAALKSALLEFVKGKIVWLRIATMAQGLSFADITRACEDAIKDALIHDRKGVSQKEIEKMISERKKVRMK